MRAELLPYPQLQSRAERRVPRGGTVGGADVDGDAVLGAHPCCRWVFHFRAVVCSRCDSTARCRRHRSDTTGEDARVARDRYAHDADERQCRQRSYVNLRCCSLSLPNLPDISDFASCYNDRLVQGGATRGERVCIIALPPVFIRSS